MRAYDGVEAIDIAAQCHVQDSPLKVRVGAENRGVELVDPIEAAASKVRVETSSEGMQSLRKCEGNCAK